MDDPWEGWTSFENAFPSGLINGIVLTGDEHGSIYAYAWNSRVEQWQTRSGHGPNHLLRSWRDMAGHCWRRINVVPPEPLEED